MWHRIPGGMVRRQVRHHADVRREITEVFPNEPVIDRTSINAWIDSDYRKAIAATKRKRIVIAGVTPDELESRLQAALGKNR